MKKILYRIYHSPLFGVIASLVINASFWGVLWNMTKDIFYTTDNVLAIIVFIFTLLSSGIIYLLIQKSKVSYLNKQIDERLILDYYFVLNTDGKTLNLLLKGERTIKSLRKSLHKIDVYFSVENALTKPDFIENPKITECLLKTSGGSDRCSIERNYNNSENIGFRIKFIPSLERNETITFKYELKIAKFKCASSEFLHESLSLLPAGRKNAHYRNGGEREYLSFPIEYQTKKIEVYITFAKECKINDDNISVEKQHNNTVDKVKDLLTHKNGDYGITLKEGNPQIGTNYIWAWDPPKKSELTKSHL